MTLESLGVQRYTIVTYTLNWNHSSTSCW